MTEEKELRSGFTTGTCAAAAAKAAAQMLFFGRKKTRVSVMTPAGREAEFAVEEFTVEESAAAYEDDEAVTALQPLRPKKIKSARCAVRKDAGDDPDVTNGTLIYASVSRVRELPSGAAFYKDPEEELPLYITGGAGIGVVTKDGLSCPKGFYAINPVPRQMIFSEVSAVLKDSGAEADSGGEAESGRYSAVKGPLEPGECILIEISIPDGARLAENTFNPNLGIQGGISVLGTTGIVNPMSENALIETIRLDIRVRAAQGKRELAVAPGNYGEVFLREQFGLSMDSFVKCSNFAGETFRMMREEGIRRVLFAGHLGKLIKVAGGVLNTHSRYGDRRMEILADCAAAAGVPQTIRRELLNKNTTEEAAEFLRDCGCLAPVAGIAAGRVKQTLEDYSGLPVEAVLFTGNCGILAMTQGAAKLAEWLRREESDESGCEESDESGCEESDASGCEDGEGSRLAVGLQ